ncbi:MAG: metallophosphoesterase family protein [bacterium]|nr:metallophosphoesterase family protein [bacterium]
MKILVFSDTHLTEVFDEKKYQFLKRIIKDADKIIILGDFWDGYQTTFDKFISSKWNMLFPLLKQKGNIYCYGNHDQKQFSDNKTSLFSIVQTYQYQIKIEKTTFIFEHGDRLFKSPDLIIDNRKISTILTYISHVILGNLFHRILKKNPLDFILDKSTKIVQKKIHSIIKKNEIYILGHMHRTTITNEYVNSGFIDYGIGQYVLIENGKLLLKEESYA